MIDPLAVGEPEEIVSRLRRRIQTDEIKSPTTVLRFGDLEMDRAERRVTQAGREVALTATEFSLLEALLRRGGKTVSSRMDLLREVWRAPPAMGTNIVEVYINYLRRKLGSQAGHDSVIRTVRGEGYVLGAESRPAKATMSAKNCREADKMQQRVG